MSEFNHRTMEELEGEVLELLAEEGPMSAAYIGLAVFGIQGRTWTAKNTWRNTEWRKPQAFCRPAGKVLKRLERKKKVVQRWNDYRKQFEWALIN